MARIAQGTTSLLSLTRGNWSQSGALLEPVDYPPLQNGPWTIGADGLTHTLVFSENITAGAGGTGGFVANMSGGAVTLAYLSGGGTPTVLWTGSRTVLATETETGSKGAYTQPGDGIIDNPVSNNELASFTGHTITNNSTQVPPDVTAPTLSSATIDTAGTTLTLVFSEAVTAGAGGAAGFVLTPTGAGVTLTYVSGNGTTGRVFTISRAILQTSEETATLAYTQPGDGMEDAAGNDLATFSGTAVINNSAQTGVGGGPVFTPVVTDDFNDGANGAALSARTGYAAVLGDFGIINPGGAGSVYPDTAGAECVIRVTAAHSSDQYGILTLSDPGHSGALGVALRVQSGAATYYECTYFSAAGDLYVITNVSGGARTVRSTTSRAYVAGDTIRFYALGAGSATRLYVDEDTGSGWTSVLTAFDPTDYIDGGFPGISGAFSASELGDDFESGNVT
jgi:hypothetical protein